MNSIIPALFLIMVIAVSGCLQNVEQAGKDTVKGVDDFLSQDHEFSIPSLKNTTGDIFEGVKNFTVGGDG